MARWPYNTARWLKLRKAKLAADVLCLACLERGVTKPANTVDHRLAISKGGDPWAWGNLQSLCTSCHNAKRLHVERLGRDRVPVRGCDPATGRPLDPRHWWNRA